KAVPLYYPLWGIRKKVGNNDLPQGALPTQNTDTLVPYGMAS
ncbi:MAG: hypothetical protein ACJAUL_003890, partial [Paraglaciecola sp.]